MQNQLWAASMTSWISIDQLFISVIFKLSTRKEKKGGKTHTQCWKNEMKQKKQKERK